MNSIVAVGCISSVNGEHIVDCWRMTNFLGMEAEAVTINSKEEGKD